MPDDLSYIRAVNEALRWALAEFPETIVAPPLVPEAIDQETPVPAQEVAVLTA